MGAGLPHDARAHHDEVGILDRQILVAESEPAQGPRCEILCDCVSPRHKPLEQSHPFVVLQIERDAHLLGVQ